MIKKITDKGYGDHYHVCNNCGSESTPEDCMEESEDCLDVFCGHCEVKE